MNKGGGGKGDQIQQSFCRQALTSCAILCRVNRTSIITTSSRWDPATSASRQLGTGTQNSLTRSRWQLSGLASLPSGTLEASLSPMLHTQQLLPSFKSTGKEHTSTGKMQARV